MASDTKIMPVATISHALRREALTGTMRELAATARCAALYPFGLAETALTTGRAAGDVVRDTPVLLVHGYGHNRSGWFLLERALRRAGFTSIHTMNYVAWGRDGVPALARRLAARVDEVRRLTGADKVHIVGHSLGGVLLRWYAQELGGDEHIASAITVASPHEGTVTAFAGFGPCARDLRPGSAVMRRLAAGTRTMSGTRWMALWSDSDLVVQPSVSAKLRPPALHAENVLVKHHGHVAMLTSPRVLRLIVEQLSAPPLLSFVREPTRSEPVVVARRAATDRLAS